MHFNHQGCIYTSTINVPWTTNQNLEYICIITRQKTWISLTKCGCNMHYLNNQTQEELSCIQVYIYSLGCLKKKTCGRMIFNIWYFKMDSLKNNWYSQGSTRPTGQLIIILHWGKSICNKLHICSVGWFLLGYKGNSEISLDIYPQFQVVTYTGKSNIYIVI